MKRNEIAAELTANSAFNDYAGLHAEIAAAILAGRTKADVLDMCDEVPETYAWLKANWETVNTLAADSMSGVYVSEIPPEADVYKGEAFYEALSTVKAGEIIYGEVSDEVAAKIAEEYGIR